MLRGSNDGRSYACLGSVQIYLVPPPPCITAINNVYDKQHGCNNQHNMYRMSTNVKGEQP
jgi:hypothetical protein